MQDTSIVSDNLTVAQFATLNGVEGGVANPGATSLAQSVTTSGTISNGAARNYRILAGATATALTMTKGTVEGQDLTLINVSATNAVITGNVGATTTVVANSAAAFEWDAGTTLWYHKA